MYSVDYSRLERNVKEIPVIIWKELLKVNNKDTRRSSVGIALVLYLWPGTGISLLSKGSLGEDNVIFCFTGSPENYFGSVSRQNNNINPKY